MSNRSANAREKLKRRILTFERIPISLRAAYCKPGSQNAKKQAG